MNETPEFDVKIINDNKQAPKDVEDLQTRDTGAKKMHHMMHDSSFSSNSSGSISSNSSSVSSSESSFSESSSGSFSGSVSSSSGGGSLSSSSVSGSESLSSNSSAIKLDHTNTKNPQGGTDGFAVRRRRRMMMKGSLSSESSSESSSVSSESLSSISSSSGSSIGESSNAHNRNRDTGARMMMKRRRLNIVPGLKEELDQHIANENKQVPDAKGQAPTGEPEQLEETKKMGMMKMKMKPKMKMKSAQQKCSKLSSLIQKLKSDINEREQNAEKSQSLLDAKELFLILQSQYATQCKKIPSPIASTPNTQTQSEQPSQGSLIGMNEESRKQYQLVTKKRNQKKNESLTKSLSWWWPTPPEVIDKMFKIAKLEKNETVYDLGCGDGRIPVQAAVKWGCIGVGIDFDENLVKQAKRRVTKFKVENKVEIRHEDALKVNDLEQADVVCLYILDRGMKLIKPILESQLNKGTRVVSHNYKFQDWQPTKQITTTDKEGHKHWIYLYII